MKAPLTATLQLGNKEQLLAALSPDDFYSLVHETASELQTGLAMRDYEALTWASSWLRGYGIGHGG